jgi:hypothetical protein
MSASPDPPDKLQPEPNDSHADFSRAKLALCFTFADVAETNFKIGHTKSAENALNKAQEGWTTAQRLLSDSAHKHLTKQEIQEVTAEMEWLRARIDELRQRFKK